MEVSYHHLMNTPICTDRRESLSQSTLWTAHPNNLQIFWFQIYRCHLWHSVSTFHEKIHFSHISVNAFSLIPVTVHTTCNKQNMQRPRCRREQLLQSHPGTAAPWPGTATWEGVTNMALLSLTECSHQAVGLLPAELWSGWAPVEAPHLKVLFTPRHS